MGYTRPNRAGGSNSQAPQCMSGFVDPDYLYGVHIGMAAQGIAYRWHQPTDTYETIPLASIASNQVEDPLFDDTDGHYIYTCGVSWDDEMYVVGNHHDHLAGTANPHLIRCNDVTDFENPAAWGVPSTSYFTGLDESAIADTYTYHSWERLTDGSLIHLFSQSEGGGAGSVGRDILGFINLAGTTTWVPLAQGTDGHFATTPYVASGVAANRVYCNGVHVVPDGGGPGVDRIFVLLIWRTEDEDSASQQAPLVAYCDADDRATWYGMGGAARTVANSGLPFTWANRADAEVDPGFYPTTRYGVVVNGAGEPSVLVDTGSVSTRFRWDTGTGAWVAETPTVYNGQERELWWKGGRWTRFNVQSRMNLDPHGSGAWVRLGNAISSSGSMEPNWDPVWLRERGVVALCVGDGDTPRVWTAGDGAPG